MNISHAFPDFATGLKSSWKQENKNNLGGGLERAKPNQPHSGENQSAVSVARKSLNDQIMIELEKALGGTDKKSLYEHSFIFVDLTAS